MLNPNKFLNDEELKCFLVKRKEARGTRNGIIMGLLLYTGARQCEISAIKKEHIYNGGVFIFGRKNSNDGLALLPPSFYKELLAYVKEKPDSISLFPLNTSTLRRIWYKFTPNHNKGLHCLRHTYGIRYYNNSKDIHGTKNGLRHKNIKNSLVYLDYVEGIKIQAKNIKGMWTKKLDVL
jgi:integrase